MPDKNSWNTKLTDVEVRWIKNSYKSCKFGGDTTKAVGEKRLTKKINEGRAKAGIDLISPHVIRMVIKKLKTGATIVPANVAGNRIKCPKCGHIWYK